MNKKDLKQTAAEPAEREEAAGDPGDDLPEYGLTSDPISSADMKQLKEKIELNPELKAAIEREQTRIAKTWGRSIKIDDLWTSDQLEQLRQFLDSLLELKPLYDLKIEPYIREELKKEEYGGQTFEDFLDQYSTRELRSLLRDPNSLPAKLLAAAQAAQQVEQTRIETQNESRQKRHTAKAKAEEKNAIMEIKDGTLALPSRKELWDAFAPGRIVEMGKLTPENYDEYIDKETGRVKKTIFEEDELKNPPADKIPPRAYLLLSSIMENSTDNVYQNFVKDGQLTFYVKGVLEAVTDDPRTLLDGQLNIERKTAGVLYLENLFKPLQGYIGKTENGSRYSVLNYIGYDADSDTMAIRSPYIYQLWRSTQEPYIERQRRLEIARQDNKKPKKADLKPLEINSLFKGKALTIDETILQIAVYITNVLLAAGSDRNGTPKKTEITPKEIIKKCPRLQERLQEIESRPITEKLESGKVRNNSALYNSELRKIARAFDLIFDKEKCDACLEYEFIDIQPATKAKDGSFHVKAPTKSTVKDKIIIIWRRKPDPTLL